MVSGQATRLSAGFPYQDPLTGLRCIPSRGLAEGTVTTSFTVDVPMGGMRSSLIAVGGTAD